MPALTSNINVILKRLEVVKNVIVLQDTEDINYQTDKLKKIVLNDLDVDTITEIKSIITLLEKKAYGEAVQMISTVLLHYNTIINWIDPEIQGLQAEVKALSAQITNLENELSDIDKTIHKFEVKHVEVLGDIILKILTIKKKLAARLAKEQPQDSEAQNQYKEAETDERNYKGSYDKAKRNPIIQLTPEQEQRLKTIFRKVSKLTHPDLVDKKFEKQAAELFIKAKKAKDSNDLDTLIEILDHLKNGTPFSLKAETINEKEALKKEVAHLRNVIEQLKQKINDTLNAENYKTIISIPDWDKYFNETKERLKQELERLQSLTNEPA